jgi:hypothetical protein
VLTRSAGNRTRDTAARFMFWPQSAAAIMCIWDCSDSVGSSETYCGVAGNVLKLLNGGAVMDATRRK